MHRKPRARSWIRFGGCALDVSSGELFKGPTRLRVPRQSIEILKALGESPGDLIGRDELRKRLWLDHAFVDLQDLVNE